MKYTRLFITLITILCFSFSMTTTYALGLCDGDILSAEILATDGRIIDISEYVSLCENTYYQAKGTFSESCIENIEYKIDLPYELLGTLATEGWEDKGSIGTYGAFEAYVSAHAKTMTDNNSSGALNEGKYISNVYYKYSCSTYNVSVSKIEFWAVSTGIELYSGAANMSQNIRSTKTNLSTAIMDDYEEGLATGFTEYIEITDDIITDIRATTYFTLDLGSSDRIVITVTVNMN